MEARAASVNVTEDDGTFQFSIVGGGVANSATITFTNVLLSDVNSTIALPNIASSFAGLSFTVTGPTSPSTYFDSVSSVDTTKTMGPSGGSEAILTYNVAAGGGVSSTFTGFLNLVGSITGVSGADHTIVSGGTTYEFNPFNNGGVISLTFTKSHADFAGLISSGTGTITGSRAFTEEASVPEPASLASARHRDDRIPGDPPFPEAPLGRLKVGRIPASRTPLRGVRG